MRLTPHDADALLSILMTSLAQGAVLVAVVIVLFRFVRTSVVRYRIAVAALSAAAVMPPLTVSMLYPSAPFFVAAHPEVGAWTLTLWLYGALAILGKTAFEMMIVHRVRTRRCDMADDALQLQALRSARRSGSRVAAWVATSTSVRTPLVVGAIHPTIVLPPTARRLLSEGQLDAVLAHELAHVARNDVALNLLQLGVEAAYFFNPAIWWLSAQVRQEREYRCDAVATMGIRDRVVALIEALAILEGVRVHRPRIVVGAAGLLLKRVERLTGTWRRPSLARTMCMAAAAAGLAVAGGALFWTVVGAAGVPQPPALIAGMGQALDDAVFTVRLHPSYDEVVDGDRSAWVDTELLMPLSTYRALRSMEDAPVTFRVRYVDPVTTGGLDPGVR